MMTQTTHKTGTREEWLAARLELLKTEKELTQLSDKVARQRQKLPWVQINKGYRFETDEGNASLQDLFRGRSQLLVYHFMFGPEYKAGGPSCLAIADGFNGTANHLANHDVMFWAVSRAPLTKLKAFKRRMGWVFPCPSSFGGDFNFDFSASFTEDQQREGAYYNFRSDDPVMNVGRGAMTNPVSSGNADISGTGLSTYLREREGMSAFAIQDGVIYYTYSAYARGVDAIWSMYPWLDREPNGRNETGPLVAPSRQIRPALSEPKLRG